jgi:negative regulator of flagellin synthesis FlgM
VKVSSSLNSVLTADGPRSGKKTADASLSGTEEVQISGTSSTLSTASGSPLDQGKIDELKQAIVSGNFKINPEAIADRVLASAQELIGSGV